jgi:hypothetical protein
MAVCAQQNAFRGLGPNGLQRSREAAIREAELLVLTVAVVELERADPAVVTADVAAPARFPHQDLLEFSPAPRNGLRPAAKAAVDPPRLEPELGTAVPRAFQLLAVDVETTDPVSVLLARSMGPQVVGAKPVPDRRLAEPDALGDLPRRQPFVDECRECRPVYSPFAA